MSERPPDDRDLTDYDARPTFDRNAFLWTLVLCILTPLAGAWAEVLVLLVSAPLVWIVALLVGAGSLASGHRAFGSALVLGSLVGGIVGFALCSGVVGVF